MSLPRNSGAYAWGPDDGGALWFNGALGLLRATADQTEGRSAAGCGLRRGFAAPLHSHKNEDEFLVLSGELSPQHGGAIYLYPCDGAGGRQERRLARGRLFPVDRITWSGTGTAMVAVT